MPVKEGWDAQVYPERRKSQLEIVCPVTGRVVSKVSYLCFFSKNSEPKLLPAGILADLLSWHFCVWKTMC